MLTKKALMEKFRKTPDKYWKAELFKERGFERRRCSNCGKYDQVQATYDCTHCDNTTTEGPTPDGIPHARPCPGCQQNVNATGIKCLRCTSGGPGSGD